MRIEVSPLERRTGGWLLLLAGLAHLLAPNLTVDVVRAAYAETLDAAFIPRDGTNTRVRLVGAVLVAVAVAMRWGTDVGRSAGDCRDS
ncbi:hypothetical protein [Haloglomus salinum]|jgi:hypothetical protein|uniref:hypothetical protein n=1 Tax=Haloglomus salinum TaxID=2962673 RepID=UPI0020CA1AB2|nr:hypothetical protein [Haloglomus salinum]